MRVSEIMTGRVQTVSGGTPAANVRDLMRAKHIHHVAVTDGPELVGVLSEHDLDRFRRGAAAKRLVVADVMTPRVVTVRPTTTIRRAANVMRGHSIGCLIVTDAGRVVGIVTAADLLNRVVDERDDSRRLEPRSDLHYRVPHRKQHRTGKAW